MFKIYLLLVAASMAVELLLGIVVAPVIFGASALLGEGALELAQSGVLMSEIFTRSGYFLLAAAVFAAVAEPFLGRGLGRNLRISRVFIALINLGCVGAFVLYFTPSIIAMQAAGEAVGTEFASVHQAAELVFKLSALANAAMFFTFRKENGLN